MKLFSPVIITTELIPGLFNCIQTSILLAPHFKHLAKKKINVLRQVNSWLTWWKAIFHMEGGRQLAMSKQVWAKYRERRQPWQPLIGHHDLLLAPGTQNSSILNWTQGSPMIQEGMEGGKPKAKWQRYAKQDHEGKTARQWPNYTCPQWSAADQQKISYWTPIHLLTSSFTRNW